MLKIMNEHYFFDLDEIDNYIQVKSEIIPSGATDEYHISVVKYETIKLMLEVIMDEHEDVDDVLGSKGGNQLSIPFKLAFNTLISKKLLKASSIRSARRTTKTLMKQNVLVSHLCCRLLHNDISSP